MAALQIVDPSSVPLTTSTDSSGNLEISHQSDKLSNHEHTIHIHDESLPVTVEIADFSDSSGQWTVNAEHEDENNVVQTWSRPAGAAGCSFSWSETNQVHEVDVTATHGSAPAKTKTIFIKVRPRPDQ